MRSLEEIKGLLEKHQPTLREQYHVRRIGIFGSRARQTQSAFSDVDILVELDRPVGWEIVDLHHFLEALLGVEVDLVTQGAVTRKPLLWSHIQEDLTYV